MIIIGAIIRIYIYNGVPPQSAQPFPIDSAGFSCTDPDVSSPHSFHGVKICSVLLNFAMFDSFLAGLG